MGTIPDLIAAAVLIVLYVRWRASGVDFAEGLNVDSELYQ